jgi:hypothetical protein
MLVFGGEHSKWWEANRVVIGHGIYTRNPLGTEPKPTMRVFPSAVLVANGRVNA